MQHRKTIRRATLVAGVALGVMFAAATEAKPIKHHAQAAGATKAELELKAQVDTLKAEVQALETRLDTQAQTQQQSQAQVQAQVQAAQTQAQAAQTQAQAAQTQVQAAQTQIQTLPDEVKTEVAAAQPKTFYGDWFGNTKVGATVFSDVSSVNNYSNHIRQSNSGVDYDIKRFYLTIDHKFNDIFSADLTTDFTYNNSVTVPAGDTVGTPPSGTKPAGTAVPCSTSPATVSAANCSNVSATQLYIKKAYFQATLSDALNFRVGAAELPWVPFVESLNGYRYVENMMIDRTKFGTTTDWGVHMFGNLANNIISYQVSAIDGFGYKHPAIGGTQPRSDYVDVEGRVSATYDHFTVGVGGYEGKLGKDIVGVTTYQTADRFDAVAAYVDRKIRLGVEYFYAKNWNDVAQINPSLTNISSGVSGFGSFNFTDRFAVFGRYDYVEPQRDTAPAFKDHYFNVGLSYAPIIRFAANAPEKPIKVLDLALVYKREAADDGLISTSDGIIGGSERGTYDEIGLFTYLNF